jgi:hypothetical protein
MTAALHEALKRVEALAAQADAEEAAQMVAALRALAERIEMERRWEETFATPESIAWMREMEAEVDRAIAEGLTEEGGFAR